MDICNNGIRQFPKYFRIDVLKQLAKEITQTTVSYSINPNVYPGHKQEVNLSFKNLSEISISLYKITESTLEYLNLNKRVPKLEKISTHTYRLPKRLDSQDTILRLPVPNTGRYQLTMSYANNSKADSSYSVPAVYLPSPVKREKQVIMFLFVISSAGNPSKEQK